MDTDPQVTRIAESVRAALDAEDLDAFADLLDPRVAWGAPGDPSPPCQNRNQVLAWYRQGKADGRHGRVLDVTTHGDKVLVTMKVNDSHAHTSEEHDRWQVLTVTNERVVGIRGYNDHDSAVEAAGLAPDAR